MKKILGVLIICIFLSAFAVVFDKVLTRGESLTLRWVAPTEDTRGNPLALSEIAYFTAYWTCDTGKDGSLTGINNTATSIPLDSNIMLGQCDITMTATAVLESERSQSRAVLVKLPKPSSGGFR